MAHGTYASTLLRHSDVSTSVRLSHRSRLFLVSECQRLSHPSKTSSSGNIEIEEYSEEGDDGSNDEDGDNEDEGDEMEDMDGDEGEDEDEDNENLDEE